MGVVYKARQLRADRVVAVKVVKGESDLDPFRRERFAAEARALARIQHPNIIPIYEVGEEGACPFFSMEFAEGGSLAGPPLSRPARLPPSANSIEKNGQAPSSPPS